MLHAVEAIPEYGAPIRVERTVASLAEAVEAVLKKQLRG